MMSTLATESERCSSYDFSYLIEKIASADFCQEPFKHLEIFDFLSEEHFNSVIASNQAAIPRAKDPKALIDTLISRGYEAIVFPGCTTSVSDYLNWLNGTTNHSNLKICEGFGIAFRLTRPEDGILTELINFFGSAELKKVLEDKFGVTRPTSIDSGLQKYLHGYEISPHPDIRSKALTYMLNVNPAGNSEELDIHTHYLAFKPNKRFVGEFWRHNQDFDTCWVPWGWCDTIKRQPRNNSIVIFSPSWDTLHAIKLNYDHLQTQRTQFYGNLWYEDTPVLPRPEYAQYIIRPSPPTRSEVVRSTLRSYAKRLRNLVPRRSV